MTDKPKKGIFDENSPYSKEQCELIIKKIEGLLDKSLTENEAKEIIEKIKKCSFCLEQYEIERNIRKLLQLIKKETPANKVNKLKSNILNQIKKNNKC